MSNISVKNFSYNEPDGVSAIKRGFTQNDFKTLDFQYGGKAPVLSSMTSYGRNDTNIIKRGQLRTDINTLITNEQKREHNKSVSLL
tara:strand:- start:896 stop:1153 length:258 start_codon:yes stop_codon:yes gene_type:complete